MTTPRWVKLKTETLKSEREREKLGESRIELPDERIDYADARAVLAVAQVFGIDGVAAELQGCGEDRGIPLGKLTMLRGLFGGKAADATSSAFVVSEAARNNQSFAADAGDDWETLYSYSAQSYRALSQYQVTTEPGDYFAPIGNTGSFRRVSTAAFEAAIPEPGSSILILSGLGVLFLRHKRG